MSERADAFSPASVELSGTHLVEASAGTGKTHAIVSLYVRLLIERELTVAQLLVVTYTVAATAELRTRIRERLLALAAALESPDALPAGDAEWLGPRVEQRRGPSDRARLLEAVRAFDTAAVFTIHGFCQRVLREHVFESRGSFESELQSDPDALVDEVGFDFYAHAFFDASRYAVRHAQDASWTPGRFVRLVAEVATRPDAEVRPVRPPRRERGDLDAVVARYEAAFAAFAAAWPASRDEVLALLADGAEREVLKKPSYPPDAIRATWRQSIDRALAGGPALARGSKELAKLASSQVTKGTRKGKTTPVHPLFDLAEDVAGAAAVLDEALDAWLVHVQHDCVEYARRELARRKRERDVLFFDDLLQGLGGALERDASGELADAIRHRYPVALIDEFQDTDPVQYRIFRRIWHERAGADAALFLVGDPKQAIYGFRGADVFAYLQARRDAVSGVASLHTLTRSWRADPALLGGLNELFARSPRPFLLDEIPHPPASCRDGARDALAGDRIQSGLRILIAQPDEAEEGSEGEVRSGGLVRSVAAEVERVLAARQTLRDPHTQNERPLEPGDVAVLTRTNRQARTVQAALRALGIAGVLQSEESVFATDEAAELERVMRAIVEPEDPGRLRAAVATTLLSSSAAEALPFGDDPGAGVAAGSDAPVDPSESWTSCFADARRLWIQGGFVRALRFLQAERAVTARLLARADGERRVTNLLHLTELLHRAAVEGRLGPLALLHWMGRRRAEASDGRWVADEAQLRLESDAKAVQLITVHRSKGLEYPVTICPFLWEGKLLLNTDPFRRFHDPATGRRVLSLDHGGDADRLAKREAFAENLRLLYVAVTRAKHHCSVVWGRFRGAGSSPLAYLLHPPAEGANEDALYGSKSGNRLKDVPAAVLRANADRLAEAAPASICVEELGEPAGAAPGAGRSSAADEECVLESRRALRRFSGAWRVSSFSGLVSAAPSESEPWADRTAFARSDPQSEEGRDYDARTPGELALAEPGEAEPAVASTTRVRLADFPSGALPGIAIHEILEGLDFERALRPADPASPDSETADALEPVVARCLDLRGLAARWREPLCDALRDVLATPLLRDGPELRLCQLPRADRIDEMPFVLPVGARGPLSAAALADAFATHATSAAVRGYAARARRLGFPALEGHLRGFVDLVFCSGGRWYVVDYKSNRLGETAEDYAPAALERAMQEHDYVLQYHLYLVALHRHLSLRLPGYDYETHLGGAFYLFLRGMSPSHPPGFGSFHDRPPRALIEALSERLS